VRVVSLVPSVTETLLAWGVVPVACTRFCEQPALRHVGGTKDPDVGSIVGLRPDLVVMDDEENRRADAEALEGAGVPVHVTHVRSVADVPPVLAALATAVGIRFDERSFATGLPGPRPPTARAFVPIWRRPWMTLSADTYGASVLAWCGVTSCFAESPTRYPEVTLEDVAACRPDLVLLPSEPYPFAERHRAALAHLAPRVLLVDGQDLFWWGVRTPAALTRLTAILTP
jgi:ABC-type Fe3+-hydroxamate transport system substrate-binding protein